MPEQNRDQKRVEFDPPAYGVSFIFQVVLLAFTTLGLQVALVFLMPDGAWSMGSSAFSISRRPLGIPSATTVLPGCSAIWQGELWVSVISGTPFMPGSAVARAPSSRLIAFDLHTGKPRETELTLAPAPIGLLILDDQLWAVSETVVHRIDNNQVIPRHPRRALIQPTKPFAYQDRLAVIEKNRNDVYSLLIWNEGEWIEQGQVDAPTSATATPWFTPELRVLSEKDATYLFFSDGQSISFCEGLGLVSVTEPVSALRPENSTVASVTRASAQLPGWQKTPLASNWSSSAWEVVLVNGELCAFSLATPYNSSALQQHKYQNGNWINVTPQFPAEAMSFSVAGGSSGYLVTDDLRLFAIDGLNLQRITPGFRMTERLRFVLFIFGLLARYSLAMGVLGVGTWWLMRVHRRPQYCYGKRTVIQASILRRGVARGIDSLVSVFPAVFWFFMALDAQSQIQQSSVMGIGNPLVFVLFSIFGMWLGVMVVLSVMEGCWGYTPGKWLCGIRTLRTTLRPCGPLRALAREVLVYADSVFLITWLPGVLVIAFSPHWQRLGDLAADTVVVLAPKR